MNQGDLGKLYSNGEIIIRQGDPGDRMFAIQAGHVEVVQEKAGKEIRLVLLGAGDIFGEMALFDHEVQAATVRAVGEARILSIDKRPFLRQVHKDPSLTFRILQKMSRRIRDLSNEVAGLRAMGWLEEAQDGTQAGCAILSADVKGSAA